MSVLLPNTSLPEPANNATAPLSGKRGFADVSHDESSAVSFRSVFDHNQSYSSDGRGRNARDETSKITANSRSNGLVIESLNAETVTDNALGFANLETIIAPDQLGVFSGEAYPLDGTPFKPFAAVSNQPLITADEFAELSAELAHFSAGQQGSAILGGVTLPEGEATSTSIVGYERLPASSLTQGVNSTNNPFTSVSALQQQSASVSQSALTGGLEESIESLNTQSRIGVGNKLTGEFAVGEQVPAAQRITEGLLAPSADRSANNLPASFAKSFEQLSQVVAKNAQVVSSATAASTEAIVNAVIPNDAGALANLNNNEVSGAGRVQFPATVTFGSQQWVNMAAERAALMAAQKIEFAEIQLDPPELGPLQVRVSVNQEQASVSFVAATPQVREALEQTSMRLRELFDEQSLDLVDVDVSDQSQQQQQESEESSRGHSVADGTSISDPDDVLDAQTLEITAEYGVDHYV